MSEKEQAVGGTKKNAANRYKKKADIQAALMITVQCIGFLVFTVYGFLWVLRLAWFDYDMIEMHFVGFDNFIRLFTRDPIYWQSLLNTFILAIGKLVVELPLSLLLAVLLTNKLVKGKSFFRTAFFLPNVISAAIVALIFYFMFSSFDGIINNFLISLKIISAPINWFGNKWTAMAVIGIMSVWSCYSVNMLYFMAGLMNIPEEIYECAKLDGASSARQFFSITLPMLAPITQIILMLAIVNGLKMSDTVIVLTAGQPAGSTHVVMSYIYSLFFGGSVTPQIGYATATGVVTSIIIGIITVIYLKLSNKMNNIY